MGLKKDNLSDYEITFFEQKKKGKTISNFS